MMMDTFLQLPDIAAELSLIHSDQFQLGEYIYMGMGLVDDHRVCIAVGYKIDYCIKKALQFVEHDPNITFTHINKIKVCELEACQKFDLS